MPDLSPVALRPLLDRLPPGRLGPAELAAALSGPVDLAALSGAARFSAERYQRVPLYADERLLLRLLCWGPGQSSALHGHGSSACAFRVVSGVAEEHLLDGALTALAPGAIGKVDQGTIHQVANRGQEPLLTLHAYAPPLPVDQPSAADGHQVVIVGGGLAGVAVAVHLLSSGGPRLRVTLVDPGSEIGRGVAYATPDPAHLLNVPAGKMAIHPDDPNAFVRFAAEQGLPADPYALLPRRLYGAYVQHALAEAVCGAKGRLRLARGAVASARPSGEGWSVTLADGRVLFADDLVLATGHGATRTPAGLDALRGAPGFIDDPWAPSALSSIPTDARVLVVGTGLSAMDVLGSLQRQGHRGPVTATSRRGQWPRPHLPDNHWTGVRIDLDLDAAPATADGLARWLEGEVKGAATRGIPWQAVLGAVRPHVVGLWASLGEAERARFLSRHRPRWEVYRHRAPAEAHAALQEWLADGWLRARAGTLLSSSVGPDGLRVVSQVGSAVLHEVYDHVILCTGNEGEQRDHSPLWAQLIDEGLATPDPHGLGVESDHQHGIVDPRGRSHRLWGIGGMLRPRFFETTAAPEITAQAYTIAHAVLARPPARLNGGPSADEISTPAELAGIVQP
ncbi:MAG: hypothetical protein RL071_3631 [Pseudomonadota bacterium]